MASFFSKIKNLFAPADLTDDFFDELEETLILSDVGVNTTEVMMERLKDRVAVKHIRNTAQCRDLLKEIMKEQLELFPPTYGWEYEPTVLFIVGVNGVGKTTSIGKLSKQLKDMGRRVIMVAADTFRAGAAEQLTIWADRVGIDIISQHEGADPAAVLFDGLQAGKARKSDVLMVDTAGRLHNKKNLMEELRKMNRILERESEGYRKETLMVLDATTGQNALSQAREFIDATEVNGIILTKMDGTAKGGVILAIEQELGLPIAYIGCGEGIHDLKKFDADSFVEEMFAED